MKHLKMLFGVTTLVGAMILVGCGESTTAKKDNTQAAATTESKETAQATEEADAKEEKMEVLGLDGERAEGDGYSVGLLEGWYKMEDSAVAGQVGLRNDAYQSVITITKQPIPGYTDIESLKKTYETQIGGIVTTGKVASGDYICMDIPVVPITEDMVNEMIKNGQITQEMVDEKGGMEEVLKILNDAQAPQKMIYLPIDNGNAIAITSTFVQGEEEVMQEVLDFTVGSLMIK